MVRFIMLSLMVLASFAGCSGTADDAEKQRVAQPESSRILCDGRIHHARIESYYNARGEPERVTRHIGDQQTLKTLAGFFPEAGQNRRSPAASGSEAYAVIHFECRSARKVTVSVSFDFESWSEGAGDWRVAEPEKLRRTFIALLEREPATVSYEDYLYAMGEQLDCHATIERLARTATHTSPLTVDAEVADEPVDTIEALVAKLKAELPGVTVLRSEVEPKAVHLIEDGLIARRGYAMNSRLDLSYSGRLDGLASELGRRVAGLGPRRSGGNTDLFDDHVTHVSIEAMDQTVREVLTGCLPLPEYSRILWRSETAIDQDGTPATVVQFYGPRPPEELWYDKIVMTYPLDGTEKNPQTVHISTTADIKRVLSFFPAIDEGRNSETERGDWVPLLKLEFCNPRGGCAVAEVDRDFTRWSEGRATGEWPLDPAFKEMFRRLTE